MHFYSIYLFRMIIFIFNFYFIFNSFSFSHFYVNVILSLLLLFWDLKKIYLSLFISILVLGNLVT